MTSLDGRDSRNRSSVVVAINAGCVWSSGENDINILRCSDRKPATKIRTSSIFPDFLKSSGLAPLLFSHPTHGIFDRLEVISRFLCALVGLLLECFELGVEGLEVVDGRNAIRRVFDERGECRRR